MRMATLGIGLCVVGTSGGSSGGVILDSIDSNGDGIPELLHDAQDLPVYNGMRCGENFGITHDSKYYEDKLTDGILCVGKPSDNSKEQDGDSGGPLMIRPADSWIQIGVNTGSATADALRSDEDAFEQHVGLWVF